MENQQPEAPPQILGPSDPKPNLRRVPVLPVRDTDLFPHAVLPLTVGRESSIQLIESLGEERSIAVNAQKDERLDAPNLDDMHGVGNLATVQQFVRMLYQIRLQVPDWVE